MRLLRNIYEKYEKKSTRLVLFFLLGAISSLCVAILYNNNIISYDSSYQYAATHLSFEEMIRAIPNDYTPPLYYLCAYFVKICFGESLTVYRAINIVAHFGILYLLLFPAQEILTKKQNVSTVFFFFFSDLYIMYYSETRNTYLAQFFTTAMIVYGLCAYKTPRFKNYFLTFLYSALALYTHNFCIAVYAASYILFVLFSFKEKQYKKMVGFLIAGTAGVLAYLPWMTLLFAQISSVHENYWHNEVGSNMWMLLEAFKIYIVALVLFFIENKTTDKRKAQKFNDIEKITIYAVLLTFMIYKVISFGMGGIEAVRYYSILGTISFMAASALAGKVKSKEYLVAIYLVSAVFFIRQYAKCAIGRAGSEIPEMLEFIEEKENIVFFHAHEYTLGVMMYYFPDAKHYIDDDFFTVLNDLSVFPSEVNHISDLGCLKGQTDSFFYIVPNVETGIYKVILDDYKRKIENLYNIDIQEQYRMYTSYDSYFDYITVYEVHTH